MSDELLVNVTPTETRVATVENGVLHEVFIERSSHKGVLNNIYRGKVVRVLPGMQAAFVDIGLERTGFIHANDIHTDQPEKKGVIEKLLYQGQSIVVQIIKNPMGTKGARLSTQLSLSARYLVYMPYNDHIGISAKIEDESARDALREQLENTIQREDVSLSGGFIVRTVAAGMTEAILESDIEYFSTLWPALIKRMAKAPVPSLIHEDLPLALRVVRDWVRPKIEKLRVDSKEAYSAMCDFASTYGLARPERIEHYPGERPLFDLYGVDEEIQKALSPRVALKSGGYLIIEQTEAMVTVDVNTGGFVGHRNLEETIFKTNLEAANAIARQARLRNLGGIIILDFIDMEDEEHRRQVLRMLEKALDKDYAKTSVTHVSSLGLVEMTRKRTQESLEQLLCEPCPMCEGRGRLKSSETVCYEIFREVLREARAYDSNTLIVVAAPVVIERLLDEESANVADLEAFIDKSLSFQAESIYSQEQYDIVLV